MLSPEPPPGQAPRRAKKEKPAPAPAPAAVAGEKDEGPVRTLHWVRGPPSSPALGVELGLRKG